MTYKISSVAARALNHHSFRRPFSMSTLALQFPRQSLLYSWMFFFAKQQQEMVWQTLLPIVREYYIQHNMLYECSSGLDALYGRGRAQTTPELLYVRIDPLPCPAVLRTSQGQVWWTASAWDQVARGRIECILNRTMQGISALTTL